MFIPALTGLSASFGGSGHDGYPLDGVVAACGYLSDQRRSETDPEEMQRAIDVNFTSVVSLLNLAAVHLQQWAAGYIKGPNRKESAEDPRMKRSMRFLAHTGGLQSC
ncbi:MAG: hypothetical protein GXY83_16260 [Rhodopirellula sp.]|nr:hypothetical protein [Rhodopirellula sp.]